MLDDYPTCSICNSKLTQIVGFNDAELWACEKCQISNGLHKYTVTALFLRFQWLYELIFNEKIPIEILQVGIFYYTKQLRKVTYHCQLSKMVNEEFFDELSRVFGNYWIWDYDAIYFVRQEDAMWFKLKYATV